jgi:type I site-specific restriction endonuclease
LADAAVQALDQPTVDLAVGHITQMVRAVRDTGAITAKERWKELEELAKSEIVGGWHATTKDKLKKVAAPLMHLMNVDPGASLDRLFAQEDEDHEDVKDPLQFVIRGLVGLNAEEVEKVFATFVHAFPRMTAQQVQFLSLVKQHITDHGMLRIEALYETPFTQLHPDGVDGIFKDEEQINRLIAIIETFDPAKVQSRPMNDFGGGTAEGQSA